MPYRCEPKTLPHMDTVGVRARTDVRDLPQVIGRAYGAVMQYLAGSGEQPAGPPFVIYYNMDMGALDLEAGFPVARVLPGAGEVRPGEIKGGPAVSCLHQGPYSGLEPAYRALSDWIQAHGFEPTGVTIEFYLNDPETVPPEELQTQIYFLVKE